ncbi:hypothetical protein G039_0301620 [Pseudomonas aeruginosa VRFPA01]|nr:hypothetical protein G039_0301620 [Pseudomonas aeruginosa VRFPA01]
MSHTTHPGLDALWLTEAVRLREEQAGPLEDSEAVRQALAQGGSLPRRILTRAHWLGRREACWRPSAPGAKDRAGAGLPPGRPSATTVRACSASSRAPAS